MRFYKPLIVIIVFAICITSCKEEKKTIEQVKVEFKKEGELTFFKGTTDTIINIFDSKNSLPNPNRLNVSRRNGR